MYSAYSGASLTLGGDGSAGVVHGGIASGGGEVGGIGVDLTASASLTTNAGSYYSSLIYGGYGEEGAQGGAAVSMSGGGSISVAAFSEITGGNGNGGGGTGVEVTGSALTTVTNHGGIYGGSGLVGPHFVGGFSPGGSGASLYGNSTLDNYGSIRGGAGGDGGAGLISSNGASAVNELTGFITGGTGSFDGSGGAGVILNAGTKLTNDGSVSGGNGGGRNSTGGWGAYVGQGATLTNTYEIIGGGGDTGGATDGNPGTGVYLNGGTLIDIMSDGNHVDAHTISGGVDPTGVSGDYNIGDSVQFGTITGSHLVLGDGATIQGDIAGLKIGDTIDLSNLTVSQVETGFTSNDTTATILTPQPQYFSSDLQLTGNFAGEVFQFKSIDGGAGTEIQLETACYVRGTRIRTPTGDKPVEELRVGDWVLTASGESRPVRWLGHRGIDCSRHPNPAAVWPIRIQAGAFAHDLPARDLWVSPGHSMLVEGVLIQALNLVNGATIVQVPRARVEYWHVELDSHDILLAEGLPAESYLDTGNRSAFVNGGAYLDAHPDFKHKHWADTCVPLVTEGPKVARAKEALIVRAQALGHVMTQEADAHLMVDGRRIDPMTLGPSRMAFLLPAADSSIELRCRSFVPAQVNPTSGDQRSLGICVNRLQLDGVDVPLWDEAAFAVGWHGVECNSGGHPWRWSGNCMALPAGTRLVVIDLYGPGFYWIRSANEPSHCWVEQLTSVS